MLADLARAPCPFAYAGHGVPLLVVLGFGGLVVANAMIFPDRLLPLTGHLEGWAPQHVLRALAFRASPPPRCDLFGSWTRTFWYQGKETDVARVPALRFPLDRLHPALVAPLPAGECWSRSWRVPRWAAASWLLGGERR